MVLRDAQVGVTGDGGDVSALSGVRGGALSVDDDELNCEDFADCMFWFKSFSYSR